VNNDAKQGLKIKGIGEIFSKTHRACPLLSASEITNVARTFFWAKRSSNKII
jgi:hypothetical protein